MDDMSCDMEHVDEVGSEVADAPVLDDMIGITDMEYDASDVDYDEVAEYYPDEVDISEDYEDVGDMEPDVREDYEEQDISDELSQMLDEWEEMGEAEDPEVYEYVKKKTI